MKRQFRIPRRLGREGTAAALIALVLAVFYLFNTVLLALADHYKWYFYTTEQYDLTPSGEADGLLSAIDSSEGGIRIIFCDTESNIETHRQLDFVQETARGLAARHPELITIEYVNIWLEPAKLSAYVENEDGTENTINADTVIIDYRGEFLLNNPRSFYILDENDSVLAYNGEEIFVASMLWVSTDEHPTAYFTANHGEEVPEGLFRLLTYAGYRVDRLDLSTVSAVPDDAGMVIISSPIYDFQKSAAGSSYVSELVKLSRYLERGGTLFASVSPRYAKGLPRLTEFLASYGLTVGEGALIDSTSSLPGSGGYTLLLDYADSALGASLAEKASAGGRRTVLSQALPLSLTASELATAEPLLYSAPSAALLADDGSTIGSGAYPVVAMSRMKAGEGRILLTGGAYLAATDAVDSESYGNRDLLLSLLLECGAPYAPIGIPAVAVDRTAVENLTMGEANRFTLSAAVLFPTALLLGGLIYCKKRKNH